MGGYIQLRSRSDECAGWQEGGGWLTASVVRVPLEGGGSVLVEAATVPDGPVKAGRVSEAVGELPVSLQAALGPVTDVARAVVQELRSAGPGGVEVQFGVDLAVQAGVVITRGEASCHLRVTVRWDRDDRDAGPTPASGAG